MCLGAISADYLLTASAFHEKATLAEESENRHLGPGRVLGLPEFRETQGELRLNRL